MTSQYVLVTAILSFETEADRDRAVQSSAEIQVATRDQEPGCRAYCFAADPGEPTHIQVYELWDDAQSLAAHFEHPNYAAMVRILGTTGGFLASENRMYAAEDRGTVYDAAGAFRSEAF